MKYEIHPQKADNLNKRARNLLKNIVWTPTNPDTWPLKNIESVNSGDGIYHIINIEPNNTVDKIGYRKGSRNRFSEYNISYQGMKTALTMDSITEIYNLLDQIFNDYSILETISEDFSFYVFSNWIISNRHQPNDPTSEISQVLVEAFEIANQEYAIYFPVEHLNIEGSLEIGHCLIKKETSEELKEHAIAMSMSQEDSIRALSFIHSVRGKTNIRFQVSAEEKKAIEQAEIETSIALDALKVLFASLKPAVDPIIFDVDFKNSYQTTIKIMVHAINSPQLSSISQSLAYQDQGINNKVIKELTTIGLSVFHDFLRKTTVNQSELQGLIRNAIRNYADAVSNRNLHERVSKTFSALESLLLPGDSSPIIDSLSKYLPKIISTDIGERKLINDIVKSLYEVRSAFVHHAKRKDFDIEHLLLLHNYTRRLILTLIDLSWSRKAKAEVLREVDERINAA